MTKMEDFVNIDPKKPVNFKKLRNILIGVFAVIFVLSLFTELSPVLLVVCCGLVGVLAGALRKGEGEAK